MACGCRMPKDSVEACPCTHDHFKEFPTIKFPHVTHGGARHERATSLTPDWEKVIIPSAVEYIHSRRISRTRKDRSLSELSQLSKHDRPLEKFCTGSSYVGTWNSLGMAGVGNYLMPHGVDYTGQLNDGRFHGKGTLEYPTGSRIRCVYDCGKMIAWNFKCADGLDFKIPWTYCAMPDRRFFSELQNGLRPAGRSVKTSTMPERKIPDECFDTGDGFFNPKTKCIYSPYKPNRILRVATKTEEDWIVKNCRHAWDEPTGYRPDLLETWTTGATTFTKEEGTSCESSEGVLTASSNQILDDVSTSQASYSQITESYTSKDTFSTFRSGQHFHVDI